MAKKKRAKDAEVSFEQALERLEQIVRRLEEQQCGLDESLNLYEQGIKLLQQCRAKLAEAEQKIRLLTGVTESGEPVTEPFEAEATIERLATVERPAGPPAPEDDTDVGECEAEVAEADQIEQGKSATKQPRREPPVLF